MRSKGDYFVVPILAPRILPLRPKANTPNLNVILMLDNEFRKSFPDYRGLIIKIKFTINQIAIIATLVQLH